MTDAATINVPRRARTPSRPLGDDRLAELAAGGDESAFAEIYDRYQQELYHYCRSLVGNPDDAQDALQSTMASALHSLPGERREISLRPWLYRVAHNHAITILRGRREQDGEERLASIPDRAVEDRPEARERLRQLLVDLDALPERQRAALTMRELSGLAFEEIGAALGLSTAGARQAVYEARVGLQEFEQGREMECERVKQAISASDRRKLRARRVRAHLRGCAGCRGFQDAIGTRKADLAALSPPLPLAAAAGVLDAILGGSGSAATPASGVAASASGVGTASGIATGGGAGGGGAIAGVGASSGGGAATLLGAANGVSATVVLKSAASVIAIAAVGAGAADLSGVVRLPLLHGHGDGQRATSSSADGGEATETPQSNASPAYPGLTAQSAAATGIPAGVTRSPASRHDDGSGGGSGHGNVAAPQAPGSPASTDAQVPPADAPAKGPPAHAQTVEQPAHSQPPAAPVNDGSHGQPADPGSPSSGSSATSPNGGSAGSNAGGSSTTTQGANPNAGGGNPNAGGASPAPAPANPAASAPAPTPPEQAQGQASHPSPNTNSSK